tara:strand:+ start:21 stop:206 length:186 start_codon:yes stop_codon:yes gene_type:complete
MKMLSYNKEVYVETPSGDIYLLEVSTKNKSIILSFNENEIEITKDSAFDIADALLLITTEN